MRRAIALLLLLVIAVPPYSALAQTGVAADVGVLLALQQLKSQMDSIVNTVDQETAARIRQAEIALGNVIAQMKDAMDHGYGLINNTRDQIMGNVASVMMETQEMIQETTGVLLLGVNDSLANLARIVTALPGVNIPTYVYAVTPLRFQANATDNHVEIHGFFPDVSKDHPVKVHFDDGKTIQLDSYVNNTLGFDLPPGSLSKEEKFVTMAFDLPVKHLWGAYYTMEFVKARVYVERALPFTFAIIIDMANPDQWATVTAGSAMHENAESARTTNNQTFTAPEIFSRLVNDNVHYDMSTAEFVSFSPPPPPPAPPEAAHTGLFGAVLKSLTPPAPAIIEQGVNPCASGCSSSTGTWSWTSTTLSIALSAPDCGTHVIWPGGLQAPYQCGGGTHADFTAIPTFRVKRRDVQQSEIKASNQVPTLTLARKKVSDPIPLPPTWTSIEIKGQFKDGKESVENHVRLTSGQAGILSASDPIIWKAEVSGQSLVISTK